MSLGIKVGRKENMSEKKTCGRGSRGGFCGFGTRSPPFRPSRLAPALTPSAHACIIIFVTAQLGGETLTWRVCDYGIEQTAASPRIASDVECTKVHYSLCHAVLCRGADDTWGFS